MTPLAAGEKLNVIRMYIVLVKGKGNDNGDSGRTNLTIYTSFVPSSSASIRFDLITQRSRQKSHHHERTHPQFFFTPASSLSFDRIYGRQADEASFVSWPFACRETGIYES